MAEKDNLNAGRKPQPDPEALTVKELCNAFLNAKAAAGDAGEITSRSGQAYKDACDLLIRHIGKARLVEDLGPDDFTELQNAMAKSGDWRRSATSSTAYASPSSTLRTTASSTCRYGQGFKRPSRKPPAFTAPGKGQSCSGPKRYSV